MDVATPEWMDAALSAFRPTNVTPEQQARARQDIARQIVATPKRGFLYEAVRGNQHAYIYGTTDWSRPDSAYFPLNPVVLKQLHACDRVLVSLDPTQAKEGLQTAQQIGFYPKGDDLGRHIAPALLGRLLVLTHASGTKFDAVLREKPWLIADLLISENLMTHGWRREFTATHVLLAVARAANQPVQAVERWESQVKALDAMSEALQQSYLQDSLQGLENNLRLQLETRLLNAWASGDVTAWQRAIAEEIDSTTPWQTFRHQFEIVERSKRMADALDAMTEQNTSTFVIVSTRTMLASDGLLTRLKKRGFQVRDLQR